MPFTVSHAAAAAPLWRLSRQRLVLSALIVGAVAPDLEYLVHLSTRRTIGHTLPGLFVLCLPLGLVGLFAWHRLVAPAWAPMLTGSRPPRFAFGPLARLGVLALSVLAGSLSHLAWDAFTHESGLVVSHVALLQSTLPGTGVHVYSLLQHASSGAGAVFLALWAHRGVGSARPAAPAELLVPSVAVGCASAGGAIANGFASWVTGGALHQVLAAAAVGAMTAGTLAVLVASAALLWWRSGPPATRSYWNCIRTLAVDVVPSAEESVYSKAALPPP
ncbi:MAG: DUF4184 family protein [Acidimicrobiia bacterium]